MSAALDAILLDTDSILEVTVEIDSAHRVTGSLRTWYYSTHDRSTDSGKSPANTVFYPYLRAGGVLGPLTQALSADLMFSGIADNNPGTLTLLQTNLDTDEMSAFYDYVFAGYKLRIKIGKESETDYDNFVLFRTLTVDIDPTVTMTSEGMQAVFQLSSVLRRMIEEPLIVKRYVGIPTCVELMTTSAVAQTSYNAAHDLRNFTLMYRVRVSTAPAANRNLMAKTGGTSNNNFVLSFNTTGFIECMASLGGVATTLHISSTNLISVNPSWHEIVWSLQDKTTSYLMIDGVVISTFTPTASVDLPAVGVRMARFLLGKHSDARIYNRYIPPDEARSLYATRSTGTDLGCVGCWRFDDGGAAVVANDYSPTNADATWTGVLNTDYKWTFSDLGEPELAGRPYPLVEGNVLNAQAHLIDSLRERYRGNVDGDGWFTVVSNNSLIIRSQGTTLTNVTDYDAPSGGGDGVFSMVSQEAEPVTYDLLNNGTFEESVYPSIVAEQILLKRTRLTSADIANQNSMSLMCPWPSGYYTDQDATARDMLAEVLGQAGMYYYEEPEGALWIDMLLPSTGYGPYGEPVLDLLGRLNAGVTFGDVADISGSCTIACWVKVNLFDQTTYNFGASEPNVGTSYLVAKSLATGNYAAYFQSIGTNAGKLGFTIAGTTLRTEVGVISPYTWHFAAFVFDDTGNTMKIYSAPLGSTLAEVASTSNTSSPTTNNNPLTIGGFGYPWISVQHLQVWSVVKNISQLQALMATPPVGNESNLPFYAPINEGIGDPINVVTGLSGTLIGNSALPEWAPKFTINLSHIPSIKLSDFHHLHPAWNIIVNYAKNNFPMSDSDIDTDVSQNERLNLTQTHRDVRYENQEIRDRFKHAKKVILDSRIEDQESAQRLIRVIKSRLNTDSYVGLLTFPPGLNISRQAVGLRIGNEIGISSSFPSQLASRPRSFKVVSVAPNLLKLSTTIAFAG